MGDTVLFPVPTDQPGKRPLRALPKKDRVRSAWISFTGRILAQLIGAAATVGLGFLILHKSSSTATTPPTNPVIPTANVSSSIVAARTHGQAVVAVLPLDDYSNSGPSDHFADGITEALITDLSQSDQVRVISRTSSMHYKARRVPIPEVARELGVDFVVEGSAVRLGERVRVTAQLIDARTDEHVWARRYDRSATDLLSLQSEIARLIAREIDSVLSASSGTKLTSN